MSLTILIIYFLIFSFVGWIVDSTSSSLVRKKFVNSGYFRTLPLCPLYGIGGVILFIFVKYTSLPNITAIIMGTLITVAVEYLGGVFCVNILEERLWDYSQNTLHVHGHIDLTHSFLWGILVAIFYYIFPFLLTLDILLEHILVLPHILDVSIFVAFCLAAYKLTAQQKKFRHSR